MESIHPTPGPIEFRCDDPNLTPAAGLVTMRELDRVLGIISTIDEKVGSLYRPGARHTPYSAGEVVMAVVESQLSGGDFLCDIDARRADGAGAELRAVAHPPASTTVGYLARRFEDKQLAALEASNAALVTRAFEILPGAERSRLVSLRPSIDLDPTDVEVYGKKKRGMAFNYAGQRCGRPHPAVWAEGGSVLAADLGSGTDDPRPQAPSLIARAIAALPGGLGRPIVRGDSGYFDSGVAMAALCCGADFAIAAKRNPAVWRAIKAIEPGSWAEAKDMEGAQVALCDYRPAGWPELTRAVVRRVRVDAAEIRADPRSRRRRTIDPDELAAVRRGVADHAYAYVVILTSLDWDPAEIEAWFRLRAQVEERLKDSKLGLALGHLPSGYPATNALWMWAAFLALNFSATLSALARATGSEPTGAEPSADEPTEAEPTEAEPTEAEGTEAEGTEAEGTEAGGSEAEPTEEDDDQHQRAPWRPRRRPDRAHGKRLRREIIMVPARVAHHARRLVVHLHPSQEGGPMLAAYASLVRLPSFAPT